MTFNDKRHSVLLIYSIQVFYINTKNLYKYKTTRHVCITLAFQFVKEHVIKDSFNDHPGITS